MFYDAALIIIGIYLGQETNIPNIKHLFIMAKTFLYRDKDKDE